MQGHDHWFFFLWNHQLIPLGKSLRSGGLMISLLYACEWPMILDSTTPIWRDPYLQVCNVLVCLYQWWIRETTCCPQASPSLPLAFMFIEFWNRWPFVWRSCMGNDSPTVNKSGMRLLQWNFVVFKLHQMHTWDTTNKIQNHLIHSTTCLTSQVC